MVFQQQRPWYNIPMEYLSLNKMNCTFVITRIIVRKQRRMMVYPVVLVWLVDHHHCILQFLFHRWWLFHLFEEFSSHDDFLHRQRRPLHSVSTTETNQSHQFITNYFMGGISGSLSKTLMAPFEQSSLLFQSQYSNPSIRYGQMPPYTSTWDCMRRIIREGGLSGACAMCLTYPSFFSLRRGPIDVENEPSKAASSLQIGLWFEIPLQGIW